MYASFCHMPTCPNVAPGDPHAYLSWSLDSAAFWAAFVHAGRCHAMDSPCVPGSAMSHLCRALCSGAPARILIGIEPSASLEKLRELEQLAGSNWRSAGSSYEHTQTEIPPMKLVRFPGVAYTCHVQSSCSAVVSRHCKPTWHQRAQPGSTRKQHATVHVQVRCSRAPVFLVWVQGPAKANARGPVTAEWPLVPQPLRQSLI